MKRWWRNLAASAALFAVALLPFPAAAQTVSPLGATIAAGGSTGNVALPASTKSFPALLLTPAQGNTSSVYYSLGSSSITATTANPVMPNGGVCIPNVGPATTLAVLAVTGTPVINLTQMTTCPNFSGLSPSGGGGGGGVSSVGLALPTSVFSISGSPVTGSGTLTGTFLNQSANTVFAGPTTGSAAAPAFRALVAADIPQIPISTGVSGLGTGIATALGANLNGSGALTATTSPIFVTPTLGVATSTSEAIGGGSAITSSGPGGVMGTGAFAAAGITALTGDVTATGPGSSAATLASVATAGTTGSSTAIPVVTINAKGLTTGITTAAVVAPAGTLSGTTLNSTVVTSSLTSVGTLTSLTSSGIIATTAAGTAANPEITVGNATTGLFSASTTGFGIAVNGTSRADYGITTGSQWTFAGQVNSTSSFGLANSGGIFWSGRGILTSGAAGDVNFGAAASGTPVAQTVSFQSGSGTNIAGPNATIIGALATGNVNSGDVIFQTGGAVAGSGTTAATATTAMTIKGVTQNVNFASQITVAAMTQSAAAQSGTMCYNTSGGTVTYDASVGCLSSLEELKDIHGPITGALDEVAALKPFWFTPINRPAGSDLREQPGFGAHQVEAVDKRLVGYGANGELRGVRYMEMTAVLAAAINELKADNDNMRQEIKALRTGTR